MPSARSVIRFPLVPTLVVGAAVALMIGLGLWQLLWRAPEKDALLRTYVAAQGQPPIAFPTTPFAGDPPLFRRASGLCLSVAGWRQAAGQNAKGEVGYAFIADCRTGAEGPGMVVVAGWSANPQTKPSWSGGPVSGVIAPDEKSRMRLVSATGLGGLQASAAPSPEAIPNNHRSYAFQWFAFAAIALVIYLLALAKRGREADR
jgi:cytochrome oxidase assembly protein ShyY1